ncbi:MAG: hypothetical protein IH594_17855 [Bacteroidales bacterium]|nr:hypothetical protein [Bacteroidales bacterium]
MTIDIMSTLCEIIGIDTREATDGISLLVALSGDEQITDDHYVYRIRREEGPFNVLCNYAEKYKNHKMIQNPPFQLFEFFNIDDDPSEKQYGIEISPNRAKGLKNHLNSYQGSRAYSWQGD